MKQALWAMITADGEAIIEVVQMTSGRYGVIAVSLDRREFQQMSVRHRTLEGAKRRARQIAGIN